MVCHVKPNFQSKCLIKKKHIARIAIAVPVTLYSMVTVNVEIVVLNCQKCNQCLKGHKSQGLLSDQMSQRSQVTKVTL